ncbi:MAG: TIGR02466 family protein [Synechococcaceae cyanobacterium ELA445]
MDLSASAPQPLPLPLPLASELAIQSLFPLALGSAQLRLDPLDLAVMLQEILNLRGAAGGNPDPACAWTGDLHGQGQLHRHPAFGELCRLVERHALAYLQRIGFELSAVSLHVQRCWPVVSEPGQVVGRHHHPTAHLSAVVYLNGDGSGASGCLRLYPPRAINELVPGLAVGHGGPIRQDSHFNAPWAEVAPRAGLVVFFPAAVDHGVGANDDDDRRFSVSFDFVLTSPLAEQGPRSSAEYLPPHPSLWRPVVLEDGDVVV